MIELYHTGLTSCSVKVRLCLREKGVDYISRYVSLKKFEHHTPEYLALNPNGLIPTLVHDGVAIYESNVINEYIDEVFSGPALKPSDAAARARMRIWGKFSDEVALSAFLKPIWSSRFAPVIRELKGDELEKALARVPLQERRESWRILSGGQFSEEELAACRSKMKFIVDRMQVDLEKGPWLAGDTYSLADINLVRGSRNSLRISCLRPRPHALPTGSSAFLPVLRPAIASVRPMRRRNMPARACSIAILLPPDVPAADSDYGIRIFAPVVRFDSKSRCACAASFKGYVFPRRTRI